MANRMIKAESFEENGNIELVRIIDSDMCFRIIDDVEKHNESECNVLRAIGNKTLTSGKTITVTFTVAPYDVFVHNARWELDDCNDIVFDMARDSNCRIVRHDDDAETFQKVIDIIRNNINSVASEYADKLEFATRHGKCGLVLTCIPLKRK